ncbi:unnamed protein product [Camellia sinensis]
MPTDPDYHYPSADSVAVVAVAVAKSNHHQNSSAAHKSPVAAASHHSSVVAVAVAAASDSTSKSMATSACSAESGNLMNPSNYSAVVAVAADVAVEIVAVTIAAGVESFVMMRFAVVEMGFGGFERETGMRFEGYRLMEIEMGFLGFERLMIRLHWVVELVLVKTMNCPPFFSSFALL